MHNKILLLLILASTSLMGSTRVVNIPPVRTDTIHGGKVGGATCVTSGLGLFASSAPQTGVRFAYHVLRIHLKEILGAPVNVRVGLRAGTHFGGMHSNGASAGIPTTSIGDWALSSDWESKDILIDSNKFVIVHIEINCRTTGCFALIAGEGHAEMGTAFDKSIASCNTYPEQVCLATFSQLLPYLEVENAGSKEGALVGSLETFVHRCGGLNDMVPNAISHIPILGSVAF